jgi:hypothetical protein
LQEVDLGADAVHAEDLAGHLEAGDLVAAVLEQDVGLEEAGADGVDGFEGVAGAVEVLLALQLAAGADQDRRRLVQLFPDLRDPKDRHNSRAGCIGNTPP